MPVAEELVVGFARPLDVIVHPVHSVPIVDQDQHDLRQAFWVFSATQGLAVRPLRRARQCSSGGKRRPREDQRGAAAAAATGTFRPRTRAASKNQSNPCRRGQNPLLWRGGGGPQDVETIASEPLGCFRHIFRATFGSHIPGSLCASRLARGGSGTSVGVRDCGRPAQQKSVSGSQRHSSPRTTFILAATAASITSRIICRAAPSHDELVH